MWTLERAEAEIVRLSDQALSKDDFCWAAGERIARVMGFDASTWETTDPSTMLITSHITERLPGCRFGDLAYNEYVTEDVNSFEKLAKGRRRAGTMRGATRNRPQRSERYREMFVPLGLDAELRVALVRDGVCWGGAIFVRDAGQPDFTAEQTDFLARLSRPLAKGMRTAILRSAAESGPGPDTPGLLIVDEHGEAQVMSETAPIWLAQLEPSGSEPGALPPAVIAVASAARRAAPGDASVRSRVRTAAGRWVVLHGSRVMQAPNHATVIIEPAAPIDIAALLLGAYGLTSREREVADRVLRGDSTDQISQALTIAPYTVQDHLKAIFEKVGVRNRKDLVAHVFFEHYLPRIKNHATPAANGALL